VSDEVVHAVAPGPVGVHPLHLLLQPELDEVGESPLGTVRLVDGLPELPDLPVVGWLHGSVVVRQVLAPRRHHAAQVVQLALRDGGLVPVDVPVDNLAARRAGVGSLVQVELALVHLRHIYRVEPLQVVITNIDWFGGAIDTVQVVQDRVEVLVVLLDHFHQDDRDDNCTGHLRGLRKGLVALVEVDKLDLSRESPAVHSVLRTSCALGSPVELYLVQLKVLLGRKDGTSALGILLLHSLPNQHIDLVPIVLQVELVLKLVVVESQAADEGVVLLLGG